MGEEEVACRAPRTRQTETNGDDDVDVVFFLQEEKSLLDHYIIAIMKWTPRALRVQLGTIHHFDFFFFFFFYSTRKSVGVA